MELCYALHIHYSLEMLRTVLARILSLQQGKLTNESQEGYSEQSTCSFLYYYLTQSFLQLHLNPRHLITC